jgi:hypothetical protein
MLFDRARFGSILCEAVIVVLCFPSRVLHTAHEITVAITRVAEVLPVKPKVATYSRIC